MPEYKLQEVVLDGAKTWKLQCPGCKQWQYLDDDQFHGRVSTECALGCGFHETVNFAWLIGEEPEPED